MRLKEVIGRKLREISESVKDCPLSATPVLKIVGRYTYQPAQLNLHHGCGLNPVREKAYIAPKKSCSAEFRARIANAKLLGEWLFEYVFVEQGKDSV